MISTLHFFSPSPFYFDEMTLKKKFAQRWCHKLPQLSVILWFHPPPVALLPDCSEQLQVRWECYSSPGKNCGALVFVCEASFWHRRHETVILLLPRCRDGQRNVCCIHCPDVNITMQTSVNGVFQLLLCNNTWLCDFLFFFIIFFFSNIVVSGPRLVLVHLCIHVLDLQLWPVLCPFINLILIKHLLHNVSSFFK